MITVLKAETTKKQRDKLIEWFESQGLKVHISEGEFQTVLGLVGDTSKIDEELVESLEMVESVKRISEPFKRNRTAFRGQKRYRNAYSHRNNERKTSASV